MLVVIVVAHAVGQAVDRVFAVVVRADAAVFELQFSLLSSLSVMLIL